MFPARDLDKTDPDRDRIIKAAAITPSTDGGRIVVLDLFKDGDSAFLCTAELEPDGSFSATDEDSDISVFGLKRLSNGWKAFSLGGLGNYPPSTADCMIEGHVIRNRADIDAAIQHSENS